MTQTIVVHIHLEMLNKRLQNLCKYIIKCRKIQIQAIAYVFVRLLLGASYRAPHSNGFRPNKAHGSRTMLGTEILEPALISLSAPNTVFYYSEPGSQESAIQFVKLKPDLRHIY